MHFEGVRDATRNSGEEIIAAAMIDVFVLPLAVSFPVGTEGTLDVD